MDLGPCLVYTVLPQAGRKHRGSMNTETSAQALTFLELFNDFHITVIKI